MNEKIVRKNENGELLYTGLNAHVRERAKSDSPFDRAAAPYLIMLACFIVELICFFARLKFISYDRPELLTAQILGLLITFDVCPIYLGQSHKRAVLGLYSKKHNPVFYIALTAIAFGLTINFMVSAAATKHMMPEDSGSDIVFYALLAFNCLLPVCTSLVSYYVSYVSCSPLKNLALKYERLVNSKLDEIRRLEAVENEYVKINSQLEKRADDLCKSKQLKIQDIISKAVFYDSYWRDNLKLHLDDPSAHSALSSDNTEVIVSILSQEIAAIRNATGLICDNASEKTITP